MEMALEEPLNQRFVLLSESDIPLYPPAVVWLQLMSERKSRIHACNDHFVSSISCPQKSMRGSRKQSAARLWPEGCQVMGVLLHQYIRLLFKSETP